MPQKIFKIYNGRTNFWQWDLKQKLIVLDRKITEVRFSSSTATSSRRRVVYTDINGNRVCNVPDLLLQKPNILIAYGCVSGGDGSFSTIASVRFGIAKQQKPDMYDDMCNDETLIDSILEKISKLEDMIDAVSEGSKTMIRFETLQEAETWSNVNGTPGDIIMVRTEDGWVPYIIEDDKSLSAIIDYNEDNIILQLDGGDADGIFDN